MSDWFLIGLSAALATATYLAALSLALQASSRSALVRRLEERGGAAAAQWLSTRLERTIHAVALLRSLARVSVTVLVVAEVVDVRGEASLTWQDLTISAIIAGVLIWLFSSVIAGAIARHATLGLVSTAMPVVRVLYWITYPLVRAVSFLDEAVRRLAGAPVEKNHAEEELLRSIEDTHREGGLDEEAAELLENVVEFTNTDVGEIMTPRTDIQGIELTHDLAAIRKTIIAQGHSRIPVFRESLDHIVGILYVKDLIPFLGEDVSDFKLEPILRKPIVVPETKPVRELLSEFQRSEVHLAIVIDEYGGTAGLVTIEDVLEEIVGEIRDEHEVQEDAQPTLVTIDEKRAEVDGRYHIDDLNEVLGLRLPEDDDFDTVGGFVMATLGRVPSVGESFQSHNARFTAIAATPTHVKRIGIELLEAPSSNGHGGK